MTSYILSFLSFVLLLLLLGQLIAWDAHREEEVQEDNEMRMLRRSLPYLVKKGVADSTYHKYSKAWEKWLEWSNGKGILGRPAHPYFVAIYLNRLLFVNNNRGCLTAALYGIRWGHHVVGMETPTDNPLVKLAYEGASRLCEGVCAKKDPIPVELIKEVVETFWTGNINLMDMRFVSVCLIAFAGFLRIDELLNTQLKNVAFSAGQIEIHLPRSKTDQQGKGHSDIIAETGSQFCPVNHIKVFLEKAKLDIVKDKEAFLIPRLFKTKRGHTASKTKGISYTTIRELFHENISKMNNANGNFGLHSLRAGGASSAAHHGVSDRLISKQGRWVSDRARNGYIRDDMKTRRSVSLSLGL